MAITTPSERSDARLGFQFVLLSLKRIANIIHNRPQANLPHQDERGAFIGKRILTSGYTRILALRRRLCTFVMKNGTLQKQASC
jgi:hypothetical protein